MNETDYVFLRYNEGESRSVPPTQMTEKEVRELLAASYRQFDALIEKLKKGREVKTKYASYRAITLQQYQHDNATMS